MTAISPQYLHVTEMSVADDIRGLGKCETLARALLNPLQLQLHQAQLVA